MSLRLSELIAGIPGLRRLGDPAVDAADPVIAWVGGDSRTSDPGELFVARAPGVAAAAAHAIGAAERGASAVLVPPLPEEAAGRLAEAAATANAVRLEADVPTEVGARLAERFAGDPSRRLQLVAVTGTNGKTTTSWLARQLLGAGDPATPVGLVGTVSVHDGRAMHDARLTTPDPFELSPLLARMVDHGCRAAVMEASSHGLHQGRLSGVQVAVGVFTNLTGDHLDYHGTMDAYAEAKRRLFDDLAPGSTAVINIDDPRGAFMVAAATASGARVLRVSGADASAEIFVEIRGTSIDGTRIAIRGPWEDESSELVIPLVGAFNAMNAAEAAGAAYALGVDGPAIRARLECMAAPPGRLEPVHPLAGGGDGGGDGGGGGGPRVFVDYAHTDDALDRMLAAVRPLVPAGGRLFGLFGCGGDRDRTKRPRMAAAVAAHADVVVLSSDNPRTEDPGRILDDAAAGLPATGGPQVHRDVDRGRAIAWAIAEAGPDDVVVIAGKGHEKDQIIGTERRPFDDVAVARNALDQRMAASGATS